MQQFHDDDSAIAIRCDGGESCTDSGSSQYDLTNGGDIYFTGYHYSSASRIYIPATVNGGYGSDIYCTGEGGCHGRTLYNVTNVYCLSNFAYFDSPTQSCYGDMDIWLFRSYFADMEDVLVIRLKLIMLWEMFMELEIRYCWKQKLTM